MDRLRFESLTPQERACLRASIGRTNDEVAVALGIAPGTVRTHIARARVKLGGISKLQAARALLTHEAGGTHFVPTPEMLIAADQPAMAEVREVRAVFETETPGPGTWAATPRRNSLSKLQRIALILGSAVLLAMLLLQVLPLADSAERLGRIAHDQR